MDKEFDWENYKVVVVIPAYNEERCIGSVVLKLHQYPVEILVVDDGSRDETALIATAAGARVIRHLRNQGKGVALNTGLQAARQLDPDALVLIDGDGQHLPEQLPALLQPVLSGEADMVVGSRYLEHTSEVPNHRVWGHRLFNLVTAAASGVMTTDSQSGYRAFSPRAMHLLSFSSTGFSVESEMQFLAHEHHLHVVEVPITIRYADKAKRSVFGQGMSVLNGILRLTGQMRPLLFFGLPGLFVLLAGLGLGVYVVDIYTRFKTLAVGYAILSVMLTIIGMLGLSTGVTLHSMRGLLHEMYTKYLNLDR